MIDYILKKNPYDYHAGFKANNDIEKLLREYNINFLEEYKTEKRIVKLFNLIKAIIKIKNNYFFQFTGSNYYDLILIPIIKKIKKKKICCVLHDLEGIRQKNNKILKKEIFILKNVDYIISHNQKMTDILVKMGIKKERIYNLNIFDYLLEDKVFEETFQKKSDICFAGNLIKSPFIYKFDEKYKKLKIDIFGINYDKTKDKGIFNYKGAFPPDEIHNKLTGKYGLIWDGDSLKECNGSLGEYLKINNPHKFSLYIAAGIPVITWKKAAIAEFIEKNNIGITIYSLEELINYFNNFNEKKYEEQKKNVLRLREKIINGDMFKKIFGEINEKFEN